MLCELQNYGIQQATDMCKRMLAEGTPGLHMYTLNLERSAVQILENLGLISKDEVRVGPIPLSTNHLQPCTDSAHSVCLG